MKTFLEFYTALLKFVNHKLFSDLSLNAKTILSEVQSTSSTLNYEAIQTLQKAARKKF